MAAESALSRPTMHRGQGVSMHPAHVGRIKVKFGLHLTRFFLLVWTQREVQIKMLGIIGACLFAPRPIKTFLKKK